MVNERDITAWLQESFADADIEVSGDGRHFHAKVVCAKFNGISRLARHRRVYQALGDRVGGLIHALSLTTLTPEELG